MINLPDCPKCTNSSTSFRKEKIIVNGEELNAVICNGCGTIILTYKDSEQIEEIVENKICDLQDRIDDLESLISYHPNNAATNTLADDQNTDDVVQAGLNRTMDAQEYR